MPGANAVTAIPTPYDDTLFTGKVDHRADRPNQSMFYRFSLQKNSSDNDQITNPALTDLSGGSTNVNDIYDFVANHTFNIGGDRLNQFAFHFQDFQNEILGVSDDPIMIFGRARVPHGAGAEHAAGDDVAEVSVPQRFHLARAGITR